MIWYNTVECMHINFCEWCHCTVQWPPVQYETVCVCHAPPYPLDTPLRWQRQHSNAVNVNTKERHCKLLHRSLRQDESSSKSNNGGLFKPRKQLLALGSIFAVSSVNYTDDIWQCGNGGDQKLCNMCVRVDMACDISEFMFLNFNVVCFC